MEKGTSIDGIIRSANVVSSKAMQLATGLKKRYDHGVTLLDHINTSGLKIDRITRLTDELSVGGERAAKALGLANKILNGLHVASEGALAYRALQQNDWPTALANAGNMREKAGGLVPIAGVSDMLEYYGSTVSAIGKALGGLQILGASHNRNAIVTCQDVQDIGRPGAWFGTDWARAIIQTEAKSIDEHSVGLPGWSIRRDRSASAMKGLLQAETDCCK
jgi:hypothetical protein